MSDSDIFLTLAEVAVAFGGFASLVGILGRRSSVDDPRILGVRMRVMLLTSLMVVLFSLLPFVVARLGASSELTWTTSTLVLLLATAAYLTWILVTFRRIRRSDITSNWLQRWIILPVLYVTFIGVAILLIVNAVVRSPGIYLAALVILLFHSGFAFVLIVFSFLPGIDWSAGGVKEQSADE